MKTSDFSDIFILKYKNDKRYKRLIVSPRIFDFYHHLRWEDVKIVSPEQLGQYATSNLVKEALDSIIYELFLKGDSGTKKPLDSSIQYDPDSIFEINKPEGDGYGSES